MALICTDDDALFSILGTERFLWVDAYLEHIRLKIKDLTHLLFVLLKEFANLFAFSA